MTPKSLLLIGALILTIIVVAVILNQPSDSPEAGHAPVAAPPPGQTPAPSKDNVSQGVLRRMEELQHVVEKDPRDAVALLELAHLYQDGHNMAQALQYYARSLEAAPTQIDARVDFAVCLFETGKREEAMKQTQIVLTQEPSNLKGLYNAGAIYGNMGVKDSAAYYWSKLLKLGGDDNLVARAKANLSKIGVQTPG